MTREEIIGWLRAFMGEEQSHIDQCHDHQGRHALRAEALRAAIALLTPPPTAEIEAVRAQFKMCECGQPDCSVNRVNSTLDRALNALAREPGMEKSLEWERAAAGVNLQSALEAQKVRPEKAARIAALEARVAKAEGQRDRLNDLSIARMHEIAALEARLCQALEAAHRLPLGESREIRSILEASLAPCPKPESRIPDRCGVCGEVYVGDVVEASAEHECPLSDEEAPNERIVELEKQRDALNHINAEQQELLSRRDLRITALTMGVAEYERKLAELRAREKQLWGAVEAWEEAERTGQPLTTRPAFIVRALLSGGKTP
jgi:hypothetical protein